jgi:hypothetical protein
VLHSKLKLKEKSKVTPKTISENQDYYINKTSISLNVCEEDALLNWIHALDIFHCPPFLVKKKVSEG